MLRERHMKREHLFSNAEKGLKVNISKAQDEEAELRYRKDHAHPHLPTTQNATGSTPSTPLFHANSDILLHPITIRSCGLTRAKQDQFVFFLALKFRWPVHWLGRWLLIVIMARPPYLKPASAKPRPEPRSESLSVLVRYGAITGYSGMPSEYPQR